MRSRIEKGDVLGWTPSYIYLILYEIFQMTKDIFTALKTTFTAFKERGLYKIQG